MIAELDQIEKRREGFGNMEDKKIGEFLIETLKRQMEILLEASEVACSAGLLNELGTMSSAMVKIQQKLESMAFQLGKL